MANLEDTLRDLAKRGELTHLSLAPSQNGKMWRAVFAPASTFGNSIAEDPDPVKAITLACDTAKIRKRAPFKDGDKPNRKMDPIPQDDVEVQPDESIAGILARASEPAAAQPWE